MNIGSRTDLMPLGNKPFPEPILTQIHAALLNNATKYFNQIP